MITAAMVVYAFIAGFAIRAMKPFPDAWTDPDYGDGDISDASLSIFFGLVWPVTGLGYCLWCLHKSWKNSVGKWHAAEKENVRLKKRVEQLETGLLKGEGIE